jgi:tRNA-binding protein
LVEFLSFQGACFINWPQPVACEAEVMATEIKPVVEFEESFGKLDIRVGRVSAVELETRTHKPTYRMTVDFGKYGTRVSYGRFTRHPMEEVKDRLVLGVLNFAPRQMGPVTSEVLILGVQYPKAESGEATFVSPAVDAKIGSRLF